jgi:hypothetical protein
MSCTVSLLRGPKFIIALGSLVSFTPQGRGRNDGGNQTAMSENVKTAELIWCLVPYGFSGINIE